jgi:hypothetical protein
VSQLVGLLEQRHVKRRALHEHRIWSNDEAPTLGCKAIYAFHLGIVAVGAREERLLQVWELAGQSLDHLKSGT